MLWLAAASAECLARLFDRDSTLNLDKYREMTNGPWSCSAEIAHEQLHWQPLQDLNTRLTQVFDSYDFP